MKNQMKRNLPVLMALVLILSLFSTLAIPVHAAEYTYNWGYRGVDATELSESAVAFYADNAVSYETLAVLPGAADVEAVPQSELYAALQNLMKENHSHITSYGETRPLYANTDCQGGGGAISSFYSGVDIGPAWDSGKTWNREHTWPNSKGLGGDDENDIMMLRPTAKSENYGRGNDAYGESAGYYDPNGASGGAYNVHGDVARIFLYVYVRWGNVNGNGKYTTWGTSGVMESKEVLLKWMEEDPVDTWELGRNDAVQSITGTRNVFVDYPELAFVLFGEEVPSDMTTPSGKAGEEAELPENPDALLGDADGNGKIQTNDAKLILQHIVKMSVTLNLDVCDVDGNGKIQTNDAKLILQYIVKIISKFPAENELPSGGLGENQTPPAIRG